jgi:N-acetylglucosaminyldiphosphoundecaprenol N-acetyl-beta-D-mannosaminyltransferase
MSQNLTIQKRKLSFTDGNFLKATQRITSLPVFFVNAYSLGLAYKSNSYRRILESGGICFSDGFPLTMYLNRKFAPQNVAQCRGADFMVEICKLSPEGIKHAFIGTTTENLIKVIQELGHLNPNLANSSYYAPPYTSLEDINYKAILEFVRMENPDFVWVGMGTPKQDYVAFYIASSCKRTAIAVGAAFDFLSGTKKEAPTSMQKLGLEWLFRLWTEPRRLWKRYLIVSPLMLRFLKKYEIVVE